MSDPRRDVTSGTRADQQAAEAPPRAVRRRADVLHERAEAWRPDLGGRLARLAVIGALLAAVIASPWLVPEFQVQIVTQAAIFAIVALSMNVLMGYAGQVSLGHAAFYGIGAFMSGVVVSEYLVPAGATADTTGAAVATDGGLMLHIDPLFRFGVGLAVAGAAGAAAALILGVVALRLRGLYLALTTIAYGALAQETLFKLPVFHGGAGVQAPRPPLLDGDVAFTYFVFGVLGAFLLIDWRLTSSKAGRALQALRDDERVAASWGINVTAYKLLAFVVSGVAAGVAGALFAHRILAVSATEFTFTVSLLFVLMTVVGGLGNRWGVVQGGIFFAILPTLFEVVSHAFEARGIEPSFRLPLTTTEIAFGPVWEPAVGALLLIVTLQFFPGGIAQQQAGLQRWLSFRRYHDHAKAGTAGGEAGARP